MIKDTEEGFRKGEAGVHDETSSRDGHGMLSCVQSFPMDPGSDVVPGKTIIQYTSVCNY